MLRSCRLCEFDVSFTLVRKRSLKLLKQYFFFFGGVEGGGIHVEKSDTPCVKSDRTKIQKFASQLRYIQNLLKAVLSLQRVVFSNSSAMSKTKLSALCPHNLFMPYVLSLS